MKQWSLDARGEITPATFHDEWKSGLGQGRHIQLCEKSLIGYGEKIARLREQSAN